VGQGLRRGADRRERRDEALEEFETTFHPGASHAPEADEDDVDLDDEEEETLDEEDFDEEDVIDPNEPAAGEEDGLGDAEEVDEL